MIWRGKKGSSMFWYQLSNQSRTNKVNNFSVFYAIPRNLFSIMWRVTNRVSFGVLGEIYNGISVYSFTSHFHAHQLKDLFFRAKINFTGLLHYQTPFLFALWGDGAWSLESQLFLTYLTGFLGLSQLEERGWKENWATLYVECLSCLLFETGTYGPANFLGSLIRKAHINSASRHTDVQDYVWQSPLTVSSAGPTKTE